MHQFGLDQIAPVERATCEGSGPLPSDERLHVIEFARFKGFELSCTVFVDFVGDEVEVELAFANVQVARPISRIALIANVFAKLHTANAVRA